MHIPYLITWRDPMVADLVDGLVMPGRTVRKVECGDYALCFFPPEGERFARDLDARLYQEGDALWFEDGFMLRYPDAYEPQVSRKRELFDLPSIKLDGAFSRLRIVDGVLHIDGSATYLQMLFSHGEGEGFALSNNLQILEAFCRRSGRKLTSNPDFFASHLVQNSLTFYVFAGTQWREVSYHGSLDTLHVEDGKLTARMQNKFLDVDFECLPRDERMEVMYRRTTHLVTEFVKWSGVTRISHHLTAGRDSRASFAVFKSQFPSELVIDSGGHPHTTDRVIAHYIGELYGIRQSAARPPVKGSGFSFAKLLGTRHPYRQMVAMFRLQELRTKFDPERMIVTGYLGNLAAYNGSRSRQMLRAEDSPLKMDVHARLLTRYEAALAEIVASYGKGVANRIFHLKYNTTSKVSGTFVRLSRFSFCIFESDLLFLAYMLEGPEGMGAHSVHRELIARSDATLLHNVPFEPGKSFPEQNTTSEVTGFDGIKRIHGHRLFFSANSTRIADHIALHLDKVAFVRPDFVDEIRDAHPDNPSAHVVNKAYAVLGALEFLGFPLADFEDGIGNDDSEAAADSVYDVAFFKRMYLDNAIHVSGLGGTIYGQEGLYRVFWQPPEGHELIVKIVATPAEQGQKVEVSRENDGHTVRYSLNQTGNFRVVHYSRDPGTKRNIEVFRTTFTARLPPPAPSEAATSDPPTAPPMMIEQAIVSKETVSTNTPTEAALRPVMR